MSDPYLALARTLKQRAGGGVSSRTGVVQSVAGRRAEVLVNGLPRQATVPASLSVGPGDWVGVEYRPGRWTVTAVITGGPVEEEMP